MGRNKRAKTLVGAAIETARKNFGGGWSHISDELRAGIVASEMLFILDAQDESVSDAAVREMLRGIADEMRTRRLRGDERGFVSRDVPACAEVV